MKKATLLYDQDCGFCRWSVRRVARWTGGRVELMPLQSPDADGLLGPVAPRKMESWHLVLPDGTVHSAEDAVPDLLRLTRGRGLAPLARALRAPIGLVYRFVARHRHRLGRYVGEESCEVPEPRP